MSDMIAIITESNSSFIFTLTGEDDAYAGHLVWGPWHVRDYINFRGSRVESLLSCDKSEIRSGLYLDFDNNQLEFYGGDLFSRNDGACETFFKYAQYGEWELWNTQYVEDGFEEFKRLMGEKPNYAPWISVESKSLTYKKLQTALLQRIENSHPKSVLMVYSDRAFFWNPYTDVDALNVLAFGPSGIAAIPRQRKSNNYRITQGKDGFETGVFIDCETKRLFLYSAKTRSGIKEVRKLWPYWRIVECATRQDLINVMKPKANYANFIDVSSYHDCIADASIKDFNNQESARIAFEELWNESFKRRVYSGDMFGVREKEEWEYGWPQESKSNDYPDKGLEIDNETYIRFGCVSFSNLESCAMKKGALAYEAVSYDIDNPIFNYCRHFEYGYIWGIAERCRIYMARTRGEHHQERG